MRAWNRLMGHLSPRQHYRYDGTPKVTYGSRNTAEQAASAMSVKLNRPQEAYRCWWWKCWKWHIGRAS